MEIQKNLFEKTMTVKEVASVSNVSESTVLRSVRKLYPDIIKSGVKIALSELQVSRINEHINSNSQLVNPADLTTDLQMSEMTLKVISYHVEKTKSLQAENEILKPKAIEFDKFMAGCNSQSIGDVAKILKIGRNKLFEILREKKILMSNNVPYQEYMKYFEVIEKPLPTGDNKPVTLVKPEGFKYISNKIIN